MQEISPLRQFRKDSGKTPDELAELLSVNRATLYRWEVGDPPIPPKHLEKVERVTGIPRQRLRPDIFGEVA